MDDNKTTRRWSELQKLAVYVPKQGRSVGTVTDFYFKPDSGAIYALHVQTRVNGDYALPVSAIKAIDPDKITIDNENMLIRLLPPLPTGASLPGRKVVSERGDDLGRIGDLWVDVEPVIAPHLALFELAGHSKGFTADAVADYEDDEVVIHDQVARKLK
jgi:sporulation protein YlmC with PRC-barrel domain